MRPTDGAPLFPMGGPGMLEAPHQIGHPPAVHADSSLGFSLMALRIEEIAFNLAGGEKRALTLLGGNASCGFSAPEVPAPARRGKTGHCPCSVVTTRVASHPRTNGASTRRMSVRQRRGPWALRSYAAALYASTYDNLAFRRGRTARNLGMEVPEVPHHVG